MCRIRRPVCLSPFTPGAGARANNSCGISPYQVQNCFKQRCLLCFPIRNYGKTLADCIVNINSA